MLYMTADPHFSHYNIIKYEKRPFENTDEMDNVMMEKWNKRVKEEDTIIMLGDFCFKRPEGIKELLSRLNGKKKIIRGNHDLHMTNTKWLSLGFDEALTKGKSSEAYYLLEKDGYQVALSHYPLENCPYFNVHGHVHSKIEGIDQSNHYCISVEWTDYAPVSWEEIKKEIEKRKKKGC